MSRTLIARLDGAGDVILAGPAVRAAAAHGDVTMLCGPDGAPAADLLPGVSDVVVWEAPWVGFDPVPVDAGSIEALRVELASRSLDSAAILTSFHQSPLPLALLLRLAGVARIAAVAVDYPGSLLDHRVAYRPELHEVEQSLEVTAALGFGYPHDDRLALVTPRWEGPRRGYVVVHPSASVPARALPVRLFEELLYRLAPMGIEVVVTGKLEDRIRWPIPQGLPGRDLRGVTSLGDLASIIAGADAVVVGNTGPAHIAAATGTPVVSVFAPVVPAHRWKPWKVPAVLLGEQDIACAGCRARECPLPTQECVYSVEARDVVDGLHTLGVGRERESV